MPAVTLGFNVRYLVEFVQAVETVEQIRLSLTTPEDPVAFDLPTDPSYQYVVMPMQLV